MTPRRWLAHVIRGGAALVLFLSGCADGGGGGSPMDPGAAVPATVEITSGPTDVRQGDVVIYGAVAQDGSGNALTPTFSLVPASAGLVTSDGRFVGYAPGSAQVIAGAGAGADTLDITITARGLPPGTFSVVRQGAETAQLTSDLWVHGEYAYLGAFGGSAMHTWSIKDPAAPTRTSTVTVSADNVNDVKVRADGTIAVMTREGAAGRNGITLLDLSDPALPSKIVDYEPPDLAAGVHNVWIEGDYVYAAVDGADASTGGLRVIDISDPANPTIVASYWGGSAFLHDVYVRDGLAFLSHWDAGLIILDVGNGMLGGSPANLQLVGATRTSGLQTHNAWYWPAGGYVFVGEEDFQTPGIMHVVDVTDLTNPTEVATFAVPGDTPHNFWMDESAEILYMAWYENGVRAVDVSGELMGELDRQGREIASIQYAGSGDCAGSGTCTWAPQLHGGLVYASDINSGLWVLEPSF